LRERAGFEVSTQTNPHPKAQ